LLSRLAPLTILGAPAEVRFALDSPVPFLDTYRTMCLVPQPEFRRVLDNIMEMRVAA
jgi:hypothetical protein